MMRLLPLFRVLLETLLRSLRVTVQGGGYLEELRAARAPFVLVFWHGSMLLPWWMMRRSGASALVSLSRDGEFLARLLASWGFRVLRGSSSRGGREAMDAMRGELRDGRVLCVTPDGPRGPRLEMKMGAVRAAQTMRVPLLCVAVGYHRSRTLRSWDRFDVPFPFTRARVEFLPQITIDPALEGEALEMRRLEIEKALLALHRRATCGMQDE